MGQIQNTQSQGRLVFGATLPIPGCAPELGESTGPRTTHRECPLKPLGQFAAVDLHEGAYVEVCWAPSA